MRANGARLSSHGYVLPAAGTVSRRQALVQCRNDGYAPIPTMISRAVSVLQIVVPPDRGKESKPHFEQDLGS
jgi:hypothetical protein